LRDEADIIVTNPPFSLFREFMGLILNANKEFLILGNFNAVHYKEVFPLIQKNIIWIGNKSFGGGMDMIMPKGIFDPSKVKKYYVDEQGNRGPLSSAYRRLFAYVPQGNFLMSGTIREIVSFADPGAASDEERLFNALRIACADGFVSELDQGADTLLGERGTGLSEGQMQRIAIARAIFSGSPILLLDEATSALDAQTEQQLLKNLRSMTDKTVVIVTHRPAALSICDRVLEFTESGIIIRS
jgi:ATP-binding cassette subfamily B protein